MPTLLFPLNSAKPATRAHMVRKSGWISRTSAWGLLTMIGVGLVAGGCAAEAGADPEVRVRVTPTEVEQKIFGGAMDEGQANDGVVALRVGEGGTYELCTGALIAKNLVLTARHCVTKNVSTSVSCDENGRSANGKHVVSDEKLENIAVYTGNSPSFGKDPEAVARAIVSPSGEYLCDSDIALVVLDRDLDVATMPVRIYGAAQAGEKIRSVGYGQNDAKQPLGTRFLKEDVSVLAQGKAVSASKTPLGPHEFEVGKSICQGDSGGPAISAETGAVIGVVSRGGKCDEDFGHIYTTTAGFETMFQKAFEIAGATPQLEPGDSPAAAKTPRSGTSSSAATAAARGSSDAVEPANAAASCSASPRGTAGSSAGLGAVALAAIVLASRRRRRD